jgi:hypothetical protein
VQGNAAGGLDGMNCLPIAAGAMLLKLGTAWHARGTWLPTAKIVGVTAKIVGVTAKIVVVTG